MNAWAFAAGLVAIPLFMRSRQIWRRVEPVAAALYPWCIRAIGSAMVASAIVAASVTTLTSCMRMQTRKIPASAVVDRSAPVVPAGGVTSQRGVGGDVGGAK